MYTPEIPCIKRASVYVANTCIKHLCNYHNCDGFPYAKTFFDLRETGPGVELLFNGDVNFKFAVVANIRFVFGIWISLKFP